MRNLHDLQYLFEDGELLVIAKRQNNIPDSCRLTSYPINNNGRTLMIACDFNAIKQHEMSLHCAAANNSQYSSNGYSLTGVYDKQVLIDYACKLLRKQLETILP